MMKAFRVRILGLTVVLLAGFQNCSRFQTPVLGGSTMPPTPSSSTNLTSIVSSSTTPIDVAAYYRRALDEPGDGHSEMFQGQTGIYFWGSNTLNSSFTADKPIGNPAKKIENSGFKALRMAIGAGGGGYGISFPSGTAPTSLSAWLQVGEMRDTLLNPAFPLIALTAIDHASNGGITNAARLNTVSFRSALFDEYFQFYSALFQLPVTAPKTFVVSNWEGDNQIFFACKGIKQGLLSAAKPGGDAWMSLCDQATRDALGQSLNDTIDGFIMWSAVRKAALIAARELAPPHPNVDIRFAIEFNSVHLIPRNLSRSVLWDVIPIVKPDIALYSAYESVNNSSLTADINDARAHLNSKHLEDTTIAIGEIGRAGEISAQQRGLRDSLAEVGLNDVSFAFAWNAFNETATDDKTGMSMGLWMPDGKLHVAPTEGRLVPKLNAVPDVPLTCFSAYSPTCEFTVSGNFPDYALNTQSAEVRCAGSSGITPLQARYVTSSLLAVSLPLNLAQKTCRLRVRSDIGLASDWSNPFIAGKAVAAATRPSVTAPGYDIIVVGGQSNSSNSGLGPRTDDLAGLNDGRIDQMRCFDVDQGYDANHVLGLGNGYLDADEQTYPVNATDYVYDCQFDSPRFKNDFVPVHRLGFAVSFARQYAKNSLASGRKVLIVAGGVSGSGSTQWSSGSVYLENLLDRTVHALSLPGGTNRVVAFLWSQGEADIASVGEEIANPTSMTVPLTRTGSNHFLSDYAANLTGIINRARTRIGDASLPFLISEKAPRWTVYQVDKLRYQDMDRWVSQNLADTAVIPANGMTSNPVCSTDPTLCESIGNFIHFSAQSNVYLGMRFYYSYHLLRP